MATREDLEGVVRTILAQQLFAALATQSGGIPYCNLVAFAVTGDLTMLLFVTGRDTAKYVNIVQNGVAALLIDNRPPDITGIENARAVTAVGIVGEVENDERENLLRIYLDKHPALQGFVDQNDSALMKVNVEHYIIAGFNGAARLTIKR